MLVLARKVGQKIFLDIGDVHIEVVPVRIKGNGVRIGIDAPDEVVILREELATKASPAPADQQSVLA